MRRNWTPSIVPNGHDQTFYLVINNYGTLGPAFAETDVGEADLETTITDLIVRPIQRSGSRVVAFNTAEHRAEDASEDVAREIMRRLDLVGGALPSSLAAFVDSHVCETLHSRGLSSAARHWPTLWIEFNNRNERSPRELNPCFRSLSPPRPGASKGGPGPKPGPSLFMNLFRAGLP